MKDKHIKALEVMTEKEWQQTIIVTSCFKFVDRLLRERMDYETTDDMFVSLCWYMLSGQTLFSPIEELATGPYFIRLKKDIKPEDRWKYLSVYDVERYFEFKELDELSWWEGKDNKKELMKNFFEKHFYKEWQNLTKHNFKNKGK